MNDEPNLQQSGRKSSVYLGTQLKGKPIPAPSTTVTIAFLRFHAGEPRATRTLYPNYPVHGHEHQSTFSRPFEAPPRHPRHAFLGSVSKQTLRGAWGRRYALRRGRLDGTVLLESGGARRSGSTRAGGRGWGGGRGVGVGGGVNKAKDANTYEPFRHPQDKRPKQCLRQGRGRPAERAGTYLSPCRTTPWIQPLELGRYLVVVSYSPSDRGRNRLFFSCRKNFPSVVPRGGVILLQ